MGVCQNQCVTIDEEIEISMKSARPPTVRKTPPEVNIDEFIIDGDNLMKEKPTFELSHLNERKEKTTKIAKLRKRKEDEKIKVVQLRDVSPHFDAHHRSSDMFNSFD